MLQFEGLEDLESDENDKEQILVFAGDKKDSKEVIKEVNGDKDKVHRDKDDKKESSTSPRQPRRFSTIYGPHLRQKPKISWSKRTIDKGDGDLQDSEDQKPSEDRKPSEVQSPPFRTARSTFYRPAGGVWRKPSRQPSSRMWFGDDDEGSDVEDSQHSIEYQRAPSEVISIKYVDLSAVKHLKNI